MEYKNIAPEMTDYARTERAIQPSEYDEFFPRGFDFFGLGSVTISSRRTSPSECADSKFLVTFQLMGDELGLCAVAFEQSPDGEEETSLFTELANILASKFVTQLADTNCADIMISPPITVSANEQKHRFLTSSLLAAGAKDAYVRRYDYQGSRKQTLRLAYLPARNGGHT